MATSDRCFDLCFVIGNVDIVVTPVVMDCAKVSMVTPVQLVACKPDRFSLMLPDIAGIPRYRTHTNASNS